MLGAVALLAACGPKASDVTIKTVAVSQPSSRGGDPSIAGAAVTRFGDDLFGALRGDTNIVISPMSVASAFAMLEPGATNDGKAQLDHALYVEDAAAFHASMTALRESLTSAEPPPKQNGHDPGDLQIAIANATYVQDSYELRQEYLDALGKYYGPLLRTVDFRTHGKEAVSDINDFVDDHTRGHIKKVLDHVDKATVLALVNALYLKASWLDPFKAADTKTEPFTRRDGSKVTTPLMHGSGDTSTSGDGFVAARKAYTARLAADFVLPDTGRFDDVAARLRAAFGALDDNPAGGATLAVPKLTTRFLGELGPAIKRLGVTALYNPGNLLGIADDESLVLDQAVHATWLAMDEKGTEAAAATVLTARATSQPAPGVPVTLDRPYFFRIVDVESGATLFIGQVMDPTAG